MTDVGHLAIASGEDVVHELEVRRSRFLCVLRRTPDAAAARALLAEQRTTHHTARHHCFACVLGPDGQTQRSSDDGEPSGTAGLPMLRALRHGGPGAGRSNRGSTPSQNGPEAATLSDVTAVVVRYFGGTLLGTGGLARAYAAAVDGALARATFVHHQRHRMYRLPLDHAIAGSVEHALRKAEMTVRSSDYGPRGVTLLLALPDTPGAVARLEAWTRERRLRVVDAGTAWYDTSLP